MTVTEADFLHAVLANPDDDAPRLVFADWLEEQGDSERAALIRAQIALANPPYSNLTEQTRAKHDRAYGLLREQEAACWTPENAARWLHVPKVVASRCYFHRGFLREMSVFMDDWLSYGPHLVCLAPVQKVDLLDKKPIRSHVFAHRSVVRFRLVPENSAGTGDPNSLPAGIYHRLILWVHHSDPFYAYFDSLGEANASVSRACLAWAKEAFHLHGPVVMP